MFQKIHLLFAIAFALVALPAASYGLVGGPFDNGDYSQVLDDKGVYQAIMSFPNGQGMCQFGSNVAITSYVDLTQSSGSTGGASTVNRSVVYSFLNRSVVYYKGLMYLGQCWGMVDLSRKLIEGFTNGNSDVSTTSSSTSSNTQNNQSAISGVNTLVGNGGKGLACNSAWTAKVGPMAPVLQFVGDGTMTIINPDATSLVGQAIASLIAAIPTAATSASSGTTTTTGGTSANTNGITSIINAINTLTTLSVAGVTFPTAQSAFDSSEKVHIKVYGTRKFFLSTR